MGKCPEILRRNSQSRLKNSYIITPINYTDKVFCDYGCKEKAKFQFLNGKNCCGENPNKCNGKKEITIKSNRKRYGTDNPSQNSIIQERIYQAKIKTGSWRTREERRIQSPKIQKYNRLVQKITEKNWKKYQSILNPNSLTRNINLHLDHIFSLQAGYRNNVPPKILGHWTNLRLLHGRKNEAKAQRNDKTLYELYDDYDKNK